ncbi:MAG: hypothetical protein ACRDSF_07810 [Pseudonocardiaceae bacterium]
MSVIWGTVRRGSIALAGTFLALNMTGSSATAMVGRNSVATPVAGSSALVSGSESQHALAELPETVRKCANGLGYGANSGTCDPVILVTE